MTKLLTKRQKLVERFWSKVDLWFGITDEDCWNWIAPVNNNGYGSMSFYGKMMSTSQVAWYLKTGFISKLHIRHTCDNRICVNPSHLIEGTHQDNMNDRDSRNRNPKGTKHGRSKLSDQQVLDIKRLCLNEKFGVKQIAAKYGVDRSTISLIRDGKIWKHLN